MSGLSLIALIELFPRLSATASSPTDPDDQLGSSRFTISNDGYLKVTEVTSECFLWKVRVGSAYFSTSTSGALVPPKDTLNPADSLTVPCTRRRLVGAPPPFLQPRLIYADLAIVIRYRVWPFTFYRRRKLFRFVARVGQNNSLIWDKQPVNDDIEQDYDSLSAPDRVFASDK